MILQNYPDHVQKTIRDLNEKTKIPIPELCTEIDKIYESTNKQAIEQFTFSSDEDRDKMRWTFARAILWKHNAHRPPQFETQLIYIGHGGLRKGRKRAKQYSNIFFIVQKNGQAMLVRASARGSSAEIFRQLNFFNRYHAKLGKFAEGNDYMIDNRTKFQFDKIIEGMTHDKLNQLLNIPVIKVEDAINYPSRKVGSSSKYTDETDWRCILGYFDRDPSHFTKKDGTAGAVFRLIDDSLVDLGRVDEKGQIIGGLTVWVAPEHLVYDPDTWCAFYGTIGIGKDKETELKVPSMNCYCIMPLWGQRAPVEPDIEDVGD